MRFRWSALLVVLTLVLMPRDSAAQGTARKAPAVQLGQNYPNPFNPETFIPFTIGDPSACANDAGRLYKVTLRVYNILSQVVSEPVIQGGSGNVAGGQRLVNVLLPCGQYTAYWDGKYINTSQEVASGIYMSVLEVDGRRVVKKMIAMK